MKDKDNKSKHLNKTVISHQKNQKSLKINYTCTLKFTAQSETNNNCKSGCPNYKNSRHK